MADTPSYFRSTPCQPTTDSLAVRAAAGNVGRPDVTVDCRAAGCQAKHAAGTVLVADRAGSNSVFE
jgi:hypothetical protein